MDESEKKAVETGASKLLDNGADTETLLQFMRQKGFNETDSFLALSGIMKVDVGEAQLVVFRSKTCADRLQSNIQLQESVMQAWRELSEENDDPNFKIEVEWEKRDWPKPQISHTSRCRTAAKRCGFRSLGAGPSSGIKER